MFKINTNIFSQCVTFNFILFRFTFSLCTIKKFLLKSKTNKEASRLIFNKIEENSRSLRELPVRSLWKLITALEPRHAVLSPVFIPAVDPGVGTYTREDVLKPGAGLVALAQKVLALVEVRVHHVAAQRLVLLLES